MKGRRGYGKGFQSSKTSRKRLKIVIFLTRTTVLLGFPWLTFPDRESSPSVFHHCQTYKWYRLETDGLVSFVPVSCPKTCVSLLY